MEEKRIRKNRVLCIGLVLAMLTGGFLAIVPSVRAQTELQDDNATIVTSAGTDDYTMSVSTDSYAVVAVGNNDCSGRSFKLYSDSGYTTEMASTHPNDGNTWVDIGFITINGNTLTEATTFYPQASFSYTDQTYTIEMENGATTNSVVDLTLGTLYTGSFDTAAELFDAYQISLTEGLCNITLDDPTNSKDFDLYLTYGDYQTRGTALASSHSDEDGVDESISKYVTEEGMYCIIVTNPKSHTGSYTINVTLTPQNDANSGGDAADAGPDVTIPANPTPITPGTYTGFMADDDIRDIYNITVNAGETINVTVTPASTMQINLYLWDVNKNELDSHITYSKGVVSDVSWKATTTQMVYIWLKDQSGYGTYTMEISVVTIIDNAPPSITDTSSTTLVLSTEKVTIKATITDDTGILSVKCHHQVDNGTWQEKTMTKSAYYTNRYECEIGPFSAGSTVKYHIEATDTSVNQNTANTTQKSFTVTKGITAEEAAEAAKGAIFGFAGWIIGVCIAIIVVVVVVIVVIILVIKKASK